MAKIGKELLMELADKNDEPCISIYLSTEAAREGNFNKLGIKLKNKLSKAEDILKDDWGLKQSKIEEIFNPVTKLIDDINFWHHHERGLALFFGDNYFKYIRLDNKTKDQVIVSKHYYILPLLSAFTTDSKYYILGLSRHSNMFFEADRGGVERLTKYEQDETLDDYLSFDGQNKSVRYHSHKVSASKTIFHGRGMVNQNIKEDLLKYLRSVSDKLNNKLKKETAPLILFCDEGMYHHFKEVNSYNYLIEEYIDGNPESVSENELHAKTWEIMKKYLEIKKEQIISKFNEMRGTSKTNIDIKLIIPDAYYGKVDSLLIDKNRSLEGYFDKDKDKVKLVKNGSKSYDLLNYAAILTLMNGGDVNVLEENIPEGVTLEAINRY